MRSTSIITDRAPASVVIAFGSNLGARRLNLLRAVHEVGKVVRLVCVSPIIDTEPVDAPAGSPRFLNMIAVGFAKSPARELVRQLLEIEQRLGRMRSGPRNAPRTIDIDLILCGATRARSADLTLPHPRAAGRAFVIDPLRACSPLLADALKRTGETR